MRRVPAIAFAVAAGTAFTLANAQSQFQAAQPAPQKVPGVATPATGGFLGMGADDCNTPHTNIGSGDLFGVPFTTGTTGAEGQNNSLCLSFGTSGIDNDVWFEWTSTADGNANFTTCNGATIDTKIAAYDSVGASSCPTSADNLACNDDACGLQSTAVFGATNGSTYTLQLGTFPGAGGGSGAFDISVAPPPPCGQYDDGSTENALGLTAGGEMGWLHGFDPMATLEGVETAYGSAMFPGSVTNGNNSKIGVWEDADCDGDPTTGLTKVFEMTVMVINGDTDILNPNPTGAIGFSSGCAWIGASADQVAGEFPGPMDTTASGPESWVMGSTLGPGTLDYDNLNANNVPPASMQGIGFPAYWLLRATNADCGGGGVGTAVCFGDGGGTACPCGNTGGAGEGCANGSCGGAGAILTAAGSSSISANNLVLTAQNVIAPQPGLFFQGDITLNGGNGITFGDGLRCCGQNVVRIQTVTPMGAPGACVSASSSDSISGDGGVSPGDTKCYQFWYRDPLTSQCGAGFNLSSALEITWTM